MNLLINNYCNLKCSYCFAQSEMHSSEAKNITMEDFCTYLDFMRNNERTQVRLIGGEPTLHPSLDKLIDKVIEYNCFEDILIFSNFTFPREVAEMFIEKNNSITIRFLPNINEFDLLIPTYRERIQYNLDLLTACLPALRNIGVNIYSPDQDLSFWEDLLCKYNLEHLRWSITIPNKALDDDFNFYEYFYSYQDILDKLADLSIKYGIKLGCDCNGLPICCFDDEKVVKWLKVSPHFFGATHCENAVVDIAPDLMCRGCFGCDPTKKKHLSEFSNVDEIYQFFGNDKKELNKNLLARKECLNCERYQTQKDCCGCYIYRKIKMEDN